MTQHACLGLISSPAPMDGTPGHTGQGSNPWSPPPPSGQNTHGRRTGRVAVVSGAVSGGVAGSAIGGGYAPAHSQAHAQRAPVGGPSAVAGARPLSSTGRLSQSTRGTRGTRVRGGTARPRSRGTVASSSTGGSAGGRFGSMVPVHVRSCPHCCVPCPLLSPP